MSGKQLSRPGHRVRRALIEPQLPAGGPRSPGGQAFRSGPDYPGRGSPIGARPQGVRESGAPDSPIDGESHWEESAAIPDLGVRLRPAGGVLRLPDPGKQLRSGRPGWPGPRTGMARSAGGGFLAGAPGPPFGWGPSVGDSRLGWVRGWGILGRGWEPQLSRGRGGVGFPGQHMSICQEEMGHLSADPTLLDGPQHYPS